MRAMAMLPVIPADFEWSDVGSWDALWDIAQKDADGNASRGDVQMQDTRNSLVFGDRHLVATLGVEVDESALKEWTRKP